MNTLSNPLEILHIEDNADDAFLFRNHLSAIDLDIGRIHHVSKISEGLGILRKGIAPDLVFLDLSLPDAWGLEGLKTLLEASPSLIVVVLTGSDDRELPLRALKAGAQDYLCKGEVSAELLARIIRFALYRGESQEMLHAAIEEAKRANLAKSRFLANVGHELRTPLNIIMGFTDLFHTEVNELVVDKRLDLLSDLRTVSTAQEHLLELLNDLIDTAKIESDQFRLEPSVFSLHQLIENVTLLFRDAILANENRFAFELRGDVPDLIFADPRRIRQLLVNLLSNANKFTHNGKIDLVVECRPTIDRMDDSYDLTIDVIDTGIGIAATDQKKIFEYFQQVDDSERRPYDGSGLGLTICRQLANMMGGEISVESELGEGSTFSVSIKVAPADLRLVEMDEKADTHSFIPDVLHGATALLVEDDEGSCHFIQRTLEAMGLTVTVSASAEEAALHLVRDEKFDFLVVDLHLPGKNGIELVRAIKRSVGSGPQPRVIIATGDHSTIVKERCEDEGIKGLLIKPFAASALYREVIDQARSS